MFKVFKGSVGTKGDCVGCDIGNIMVKLGLGVVVMKYPQAPN